MTLSRPTAALLLEGGGAPSPLGGTLSPAQAAVRRVAVDLSVDEAHDRVELWLWRGSALGDAEPGATLAVGLGEDDALEDLLRTEVAGVDQTPWGAVLTAYTPSRRLSSTYVGRSYVDQSVADVVMDLLAEGDVDAGEVEAPLTLPLLHVDPRRSVWGFLHRLARRTGNQVTSTVEGALSFTPIPGASGAGGLGGALASAATALGRTAGRAPSAELREGADLLTYRAGTRTRRPALEVLSPAGSKPGLLAAKPDSGSGTPVLVDPMLRTREAADAATSALAAAAGRRARVAQVSVPGRPGLRAGATVTARGADYRLLRVRHLLDAEAGYVCDLLLEGDR